MDERKNTLTLLLALFYQIRRFNEDFLKTRRSVNGLEKSTKHEYKYLHVFTDFLISENNVMI